MWVTIACAAASAYSANLQNKAIQERKPDDWKQPDDWQRWRMEQQQRAAVEGRRVQRQALLGTLLLLALVASATWMIWEMWG